MTVAVPVSSSRRTSRTRAGASAFWISSTGSSEKGTTSTRSPRSSLVTMRTARAAGAHAGADGVDVGVVRPHGDLGAVPWLAGRRLDLDDAGPDFGHLELEQPLDQPGVGAADHDLWAFGRLANLDDVRLEARAVLVALVGDLLGLRQQRLDLAEVEEGVAVVGLLDDAGDDIALAPGVLLVLHVALDLADPLEDHLLRRLRGNAAEVVRGVVPLADDLAVFVELLAVHPDLAGVGVDGDHRLLGRVGATLVGGNERVGQGVEQRVDRNPLVAGDLAQRVEELEVGLAHGRFTFSLFARRGSGPHSNTVRALSIWS